MSRSLLAITLIGLALTGCSFVPKQLQVFGSGSAAAAPSNDEAIRQAAIGDSNFPAANQPLARPAP